jgi:hypothetical protein
MTAPDASDGAGSPFDYLGRVSARIAFLSALSALFLFVVLHILDRNLDPAWHMVSEYALGRFGWAMTLCFFLLALSCFTSAVSVFPAFQTFSGRIGLLLLLCASGGLTLAAIFPTDPITVSPSDASPAARLHALSVMIGVPTFTIASLVMSAALARQPSWKDVRLLLFGFAHLTWISLALTIAIMAIWMPSHGGFGPDVPVGWANRLMFVAYFGWLGSVSWPLAKWRT